jgi:hypothetical protein
MLVIEDSYIKAAGYTEQQLKLEIAIMLLKNKNYLCGKLRHWRVYIG